MYARLRILSIACFASQVLHAQPTLSESLSDSVRRFLDETLEVERFEMPHQMEFHIDVEVPDGDKTNHPVKAFYRRFAMPPKFRSEAVLGPFAPSGTAPITYETVWTGESEVNVMYGPQQSQDSVTVSRSGGSSESARASLYFHALGVPCTEQELDELDSRYFLRTAVSETRGYEWESAKEVVDGLECRVASKGKADRLWFSVEEPLRLVKRDVWRNQGTPQRQIAVYSQYGTDGLPHRIAVTNFLNVQRIGYTGPIRSVETYTLDRLEFIETQNEKFTISVETESNVLNLDAMASFRISDESASPFGQRAEVCRN